MNTAILLYDRFTALDAIGPYEVLSRLPGARVTFVAAEPGPVRTDNGMLTLLCPAGINATPPGLHTRAGIHRRIAASVARGSRGEWGGRPCRPSN